MIDFFPACAMPKKMSIAFIFTCHGHLSGPLHLLLDYIKKE